MTKFEESIEMEHRIKDSVQSILLAYPKAQRVEFKGFQGLRKAQSPDGRLDTLGFDAFLYLENGNEMKVQVKCGTKENFTKWGLERQSFTLGDANNVLMLTMKDTPIQFYDLFLTGYELEEGKLAPYTLISWPQLIKRVHAGHISDASVLEPGTHQLHINTNSKKQSFCWIKYSRLIGKDINLSQQFDVEAFKHKE